MQVRPRFEELILIVYTPLCLMTGLMRRRVSTDLAADYVLGGDEGTDALKGVQAFQFGFIQTKYNRHDVGMTSEVIMVLPIRQGERL